MHSNNEHASSPRRKGMKRAKIVSRANPNKISPARTKKKRTVLRNGFVRPGGVDQSGHEGSPGDSRARDHEQRASIGDAQRLQHVDVEHSRGAPRGSRNLHVSSQHGSDEESGTKTQKKGTISAFLEVVIPPDIISEETSNDLMVPEGGSAKLVCKARGYPKPEIVWKREDGAEIISRAGLSGGKTKSECTES
ncbi:hypothetical protein K0M31_000378 [Melipona bicolor]|uniref:Ig-like domain-containing protein n=1 Tax=Melipona bicolor TaxID=60889 RepID=A0AA40GE84_9HYME|nr:hypothetical protein K0M31_000378 [Melipona bicolor]